MTISSYDTLVSVAIAVSEDDSAEFANYIPVAIDLAEVRLSRELDTLGIIQTATVSLTSNNNIGVKPAGYKNGQDLIFTNTSVTPNQIVIVKKRTYSYVVDYWPTPTLTGVPKYYADVDVNDIIVAPTPSQNINMTLLYEGRPPALSADNQTNYFTEHCSDALYFATMIEMMAFARNAQGVQLYTQEYSNARDTILNEARRQRRDNTGTPTNATTNTLKGNE